MISYSWKVDRDGEDAVITIMINGSPHKKRVTGDQAKALLESLERVEKTGMWLSGARKKTNG